MDALTWLETSLAILLCLMVLMAVVSGWLLAHYRKQKRETESLRARKDAQEAESLSVLAGGIAHDFNNILMGILGHADLALMEAMARPDREASTLDHLREIVAATRRAADLSAQMLAYSGGGKFDVKPADLSALVRDADYLLQEAVPGKAKIEYGLAENLPAIEADPAQVRQAVVNLVRNAGEAMGGEGGRITVSTGERDCDRAYLRESCHDDGLSEGSYAYVEVSDTGCGMDDLTRSRVFDPFFSTKFTGRGLGLPAVLGIMRGHRGAIKIRSVKGQGATVRLLFPVSGKPGEILEPGTPPLEDWKGKGTVLVVDDEDTVRLLAKTFLGEKGFEVLVASDGAEAVEVFRRNPGEIVAVVLDMTMPGMGGAETFQEIRKIRKDVPILVSSGYNQRNIEARMAGATRFGFIQKPYQLMDLLSGLREIMKTEA